MKKRELLGTAHTPAGEPVTLAQEGGAFVVRVAGIPLMSSRVHGSEEEMARIACEPLRERRGARVLVGGLGMGFTLRAALDALGDDAEVDVAELLPCIVEWNRGPLASLAGAPLADPRVTLLEADVLAVLDVPRRYDVILLDVDNGPEALTVPANARLYGDAGLARIRAALRPGGVVVFWSAAPSARFERARRRAGRGGETVKVRARGTIRKGSRHVLFVGRAPVRA